MLAEKPAEMPCPDTETSRQVLDAIAIERAIFNQSKGSRSTVVREPFHAGENGAVSGRHLRHGRKPAASAEAADGKNITFLARAGRTGQTGLQ
jgi:hypothetical protein